MRLPPFLEKLIKLLLFLAVFGTGILFSIRACTTESRITAIAGILSAAVFGLLAALLFILFYLPGLAEKFSDSLIFPRFFLKSAPLILTPIYGMISAGEYAGAEHELLELRKEFPLNPEITSMLLLIYGEKLNDPARAIQIVAEYFASDEIEHSPENLKILMRYSDLCQEAGEFNSLIATLRRELTREIYSTPDRSAISCRLIAVQRLQEK